MKKKDIDLINKYHINVFDLYKHIAYYVNNI